MAISSPPDYLQLEIKLKMTLRKFAEIAVVAAILNEK
jgi:hypothetical protein